MFVSAQRFDLAELGITRRFWGAYAEGFWVHIVLQRGMGQDERLLPMLGFGRPTDLRNVFGLDLRRGSSIRFNGTTRELAEGTVSMLPGRGSYRGRLETSDEESFSMILEVDRHLYPAPAFLPSFGRLSALDEVRRLTGRLAGAIDDAWRAGTPEARSCAEAAMRTLLACLRSEGLGLQEIELRDPPWVTPALRRVGHAVDAALSQTRRRPMLVDLESGAPWSVRTFQRAMPTLCRVWGQNEETFGAHARRVQLGRAVSVMTHPGATTERAAREFGFSTPNAFCRAMARYGLPSPGAVRGRFMAMA